jgi:streptogramin lyase
MALLSAQTKRIMKNFAIAIACIILVAGCGSIGSVQSLGGATIHPLVSRTPTPSGSVTTYRVPSGASAFAIVRGPDGNMWFTEVLPSNDVGRITPGGSVTEYPVSVPHFLDGVGIAAGYSHLWFAGNQGRLIGKITTSGAATTYTAAGIAPYGVAFGPDGNVWFTDTANVAIGRANPRTGHIDEFKLSNPASVPFFIVNGPDGNLWFTDGGMGMVGKITTSGSITEYPLPSGAGANPYAIAAGSDGALYVAEGYPLGIARVGTDGSIAVFDIPFIRPTTMCLGPDGQIWFPGSKGIYRFMIKTHKVNFAFAPPNGAVVEWLSRGPDRDIWFTAVGRAPSQNYIGMYEESATGGTGVNQ